MNTVDIYICRKYANYLLCRVTDGNFICSVEHNSKSTRSHRWYIAWRRATASHICLLTCIVENIDPNYLYVCSSIGTCNYLPKCIFSKQIIQYAPTYLQNIGLHMWSRNIMAQFIVLHYIFTKQNKSCIFYLYLRFYRKLKLDISGSIILILRFL